MLYIYLLSTPPSKDALRHSGGESLLWTSPMVTLYLDVELSNDNRPGTEQNTSVEVTCPGSIPVPPAIMSLPPWSPEMDDIMQNVKFVQICRAFILV